MKIGGNPIWFLLSALCSQGLRVCLTGGRLAAASPNWGSNTTECWNGTGWKIDPTMMLPMPMSNANAEDNGPTWCVVGGGTGFDYGDPKSAVYNGVWCSNGTGGWTQSNSLVDARNDAMSFKVSWGTGIVGGSQQVNADVGFGTWETRNGAKSAWTKHSSSLHDNRSVAYIFHRNGSVCTTGGYSVAVIQTTECLVNTGQGGDPYAWVYGPNMTSPTHAGFVISIQGTECIFHAGQVECFNSTLDAFVPPPTTTIGDSYAAQRTYSSPFTLLGMQCLGGGTVVVGGVGVSDRKAVCFNSSWQWGMDVAWAWMNHSTLNEDRRTATSLVFADPTPAPTASPTLAPTTLKPTTSAPTTAKPTFSPVTVKPTLAPTIAPTTLMPTPAPTTLMPTPAPTPMPTPAPTTWAPTTLAPSTQMPTLTPSSSHRTLSPTSAPTVLELVNESNVVVVSSPGGVDQVVNQVITATPPSQGQVSVVLTITQTSSSGGNQSSAVIANNVLLALLNKYNLTLQQVTPTAVISSTPGSGGSGSGGGNTITIVLTVSAGVGSSIQNSLGNPDNTGPPLLNGYGVGVSLRWPSLVAVISSLSPASIAAIVVILVLGLLLLVGLHLRVKDYRNTLGCLALLAAAFSLSLHCWFLKVLYDGWVRAPSVLGDYFTAFAVFLGAPLIANIVMQIFYFRGVRSRDPDFNQWLVTHPGAAVFGRVIGLLGIGHLAVLSSRAFGTWLGAPMMDTTRLSLTAFGSVATALELPRLIIQALLVAKFASTQSLLAIVVPLSIGGLSFIIGCLQRCYALGYVSNKDVAVELGDRAIYHGY